MADNRLGQWLIEECEKRGLSFRQASLRAGVANNVVANIISSAQHPSLPTIRKLARFFQVPPEFLIRLDGGLPETGDPIVNPRLTYLITLLSKLTPARRRAIIEAAILLADMEAALDEPSSVVLGEASAPE